MSRILIIEKNLGKMEKEFQSNIDKAREEVEFQRKESQLIENQSKELRSKISQAKDELTEAKSKHKQADDILLSMKDKEIQFKKRQDSLSIQESSAKETLQDANKRLAWAEMEERRLKYLQKKIDLVTQDESIKKKLKELE